MEGSTDPPKAKPMSAVFMMNNKCYTGQEAIHSKITETNEKTEGMLVLRFTEGQGTVVLKFFGAEFDTDEETMSEPKFHTVNLTFLVRKIQSWTSYPLETGVALSLNFNVPPGYITTEDEPKRLIHFQAKTCQLAKKEIPRLENPYLEERMKKLVAKVRACMAAGAVMEFTCVVDEYRTDRGTFKNIWETVEAEKPEFCNRCQKFGHIWTDCGVPECSRCRVVGHDDNTCPSLYCRSCGIRGHSIQQCPQSSVCNKCRKKGHTREVCPELYDMKHDTKGKRLQGGSSDWYSAEFVESGRSLEAVFTLNGRFYKSPSAIDGSNKEKLSTKLFLHFADDPCFSIVLRATGNVQPSVSGGSTTTGQLQHTYLKFFAEDLTTYRSYPIQPNWTELKHFNIPKQCIDYKVPKRMVFFEAKNCWIHEVPLPDIQDKSVDNEMGDLLEYIAECQEAGEVMSFCCIFDEYRNDGEFFGSIEEAIELDPFVRPTVFNQDVAQKGSQEDQDCTTLAKPTSGMMDYDQANLEAPLAAKVRGCSTTIQNPERDCWVRQSWMNELGEERFPPGW